jgi:hypothetical protein
MSEQQLTGTVVGPRDVTRWWRPLVVHAVSGDLTVCGYPVGPDWGAFDPTGDAKTATCAACRRKLAPRTVRYLPTHTPGAGALPAATPRG